MEMTITTAAIPSGFEVLLNDERVGQIADRDDHYAPHEGRLVIHALPTVPKNHTDGSPDEYALERAAVAVVAWHMLKAEATS